MAFGDNGDWFSYRPGLFDLATFQPIPMLQTLRGYQSGPPQLPRRSTANESLNFVSRGWTVFCRQPLFLIVASPHLDDSAMVWLDR